MHITETDTEITYTFDSVEDLANTAAPCVDEFLSRGRQCYVSNFHGVTSWSEIMTLATNGWVGEADSALTLAENAIDKVERDHDLPSFHPVWDVTGCEVDVARYLSGEPECMVDYDMPVITKDGRVVTLCASVAYSCSISTSTIKKRGQAITALAVALNGIGYTTELWADWTTGTSNSAVISYRTLVKGANDELDPAKIMFAYSHPAMLRGLGFTVMHALEEGSKWRKSAGLWGSYGKVREPKKDLPEGTIYLPAVRSGQDVPDADKMLLKYLRELGIILT